MNMKASTQVILLFVSIIMLAIIGYLLFLMTTQQTNEPVTTPSSVTATQTPTNSPSPTITPSTTSSPTDSLTPTPAQSALIGIQNAFAKKYGKPVSSVSVTISQNTGTHAKGSISFEGEMGGGWFLAYKSADGWIIVADGNGTISCSVIAPYSFPVSLVPECYDEKTETLIKRK
jgi:hypothetical protein